MRIYWKTFTKKRSRQPKNQFPTGSRVYCGFQGSGKTLSMVDYAFRVKQAFPKCKLFSNINLSGIEYTHFSSSDDLKQVLNVRNGANGVIVLIDEAHLFFNRKDGISLDVLTAISQQRKDRVRLVFSSQIWEELDISLRKQVKEVVTCRCFFNRFQINRVSDGETLHYDNLQSAYVCDKLYTEVFKHNDQMYRRYDTYQKIVTNKDYNRPIQTQTITTAVSVNAKR